MLAYVLTYLMLFMPKAVALPSDSGIYAPEDAQSCSGFNPSLSETVSGENLPDDGSVWRVGTNRWNEGWEKQYGAFITQNVGPDFLEKFQISADCTDAVIIVRAIFSRIHSLPFILNDNNQMLRFDSKIFKNTPTHPHWDESTWQEDLKTDLRFTLFLNQIKAAIGSVNLPQSAYPKRIHSPTNANLLSPDILPGTIFQYPEHTSFLARVRSSAPYFPLTEYASTSGVIVRELEVYSTPMIRDATPGRGVMGFRWPVNCGNNFVLANPASMPDYSEEQYHLDLGGLSLGAYLESIAPGKRSPPDQKLVLTKIKEIKTMIIRRLNLISESDAILAKNKNAFRNKNSNLYQQYSTNDLDVAIYNQFQDLEKRISVSSDLFSSYQSWIQTKFVILVSNSQTISYKAFRDALFEQYSKTGVKVNNPQIVGASPNDSDSRRWGIN